MDSAIIDQHIIPPVDIKGYEQAIEQLKDEVTGCMFCNQDTAGKLYYRVGEKNICTPCLKKLNNIIYYG